MFTLHFNYGHEYMNAAGGLLADSVLNQILQRLCVLGFTTASHFRITGARRVWFISAFLALFSEKQKIADEKGAATTLEAEAELWVCTGLNLNLGLLFVFLS